MVLIFVSNLFQRSEFDANSNCLLLRVPHEQRLCVVLVASKEIRYAPPTLQPFLPLGPLPSNNDCSDSSAGLSGQAMYFLPMVMAMMIIIIIRSQRPSKCTFSQCGNPSLQALAHSDQETSSNLSLSFASRLTLFVPQLISICSPNSNSLDTFSQPKNSKQEMISFNRLTIILIEVFVVAIIDVPEQDRLKPNEIEFSWLVTINHCWLICIGGEPLVYQ